MNSLFNFLQLARPEDEVQSKHHRSKIISVLRQASSSSLRDEEEAWRAIESALEKCSQRDGFDLAPWEKLDKLIYDLGLIYAYQTGKMPAFTNGETETKFERFVLAVPMPQGLRATRNLIKASIRRLDAKRNAQFARDLAKIG